MDTDMYLKQTMTFFGFKIEYKYIMKKVLNSVPEKKEKVIIYVKCIVYFKCH